MTARRRARRSAHVDGAVPAVLTAAGLRGPLWRDAGAVLDWCERRGLPVPLAEYAGSPRALRDHAAYWWAVSEYPDPVLKLRPARSVWRRSGIPGMSRARMQARLEVHGIAGAWQYSGLS